MGLGVHFRYRFIPVARAGGPALLTTSRHDDFELIERPAGRAWPPNDFSEGAALTRARLFYIGVARSSLRQRTLFRFGVMFYVYVLQSKPDAGLYIGFLKRLAPAAEAAPRRQRFCDFVLRALAADLLRSLSGRGGRTWS